MKMVWQTHCVGLHGDSYSCGPYFTLRRAGTNGWTAFYQPKAGGGLRANAVIGYAADAEGAKGICEHHARGGKT